MADVTGAVDNIYGSLQDIQDKTAQRNKDLSEKYGWKPVRNEAQEEAVGQIVGASSTPEEDSWRYNSAIAFSQYYGISIPDAAKNLDSLYEARLGRKYEPNASTWQSICNSFTIGMRTVDLQEHKNKWRRLVLDGKDDEAASLEKEILDEEEYLGSLADYAPRSWATKALQWTAQTLPYSLSTGAVSGLAGKAVGAVAGMANLPALMVAGITTLATKSATFFATRPLFQGDSFWDIMHQESMGADGQMHRVNIDKNVAAGLSTWNSILNAAIESEFGIGSKFAGVISHGVLNNAIQETIGALMARGVTSRALLSVGKAVMDGIGEAAQEGSEELVDTGTRYLAYTLSGYAPRESVEDTARRALTAAGQAWVSSMLMGLPVSAVEVGVNINEAKKMVADAKKSKRDEFIVKNLMQKPEGMGMQKWADTLNNMYDRYHKGENKEEFAGRAASYAVEYGASGIGTDKQGRKVLVFSSKEEMDEAYKGIMEQADGADMGKDGNTAILRFNQTLESGGNTQHELLLTLSADDVEGDMVTPRVSFDDDVADLELDSPLNVANLGMDAALNEQEVRALRETIRDEWGLKGVKNKAAAQAVATASSILHVPSTELAKSIRFVSEDESNPLTKGHNGWVDGMGRDDSYATIHITKTATPATLFHEVGHIVRHYAGKEQLADLANIYGVKDDVWTEEQEERFANDFVRYLRTRQAPTKGIARLFEQIRRMLSYIKDGTYAKELSPETAKAFDRLFAGESDGAEVLTETQLSAVSTQNNKHTYLAGPDGKPAYDGNQILRRHAVSDFLTRHFNLGESRSANIVNRKDGTTVRLSNTSVNKMLSNAATGKSNKNGFTTNEHYEAVLNVGDLFTNSDPVVASPDKNGSPDIDAIRRYKVNFRYRGEEDINTALFTVKANKDTKNGNLLYSLELTEIKKHPKQNGVDNPTVVELNHTWGYKNSSTAENSVNSGDTLFESSDGGWGNGYNWSEGMSVNAVSAYERGEKPKSKWTKGAILEEIRNIYEDDPEVYEIARKLSLENLRGIFLESTGWHHTGKYFNQTNFYGVRDSFDAQSLRTLLTNRELDRRREEHLKETGGRVEHARWTDKDGNAHEGSGVVEDFKFIPDGAFERATAKMEEAVGKLPEQIREFIASTTSDDSSQSGKIYEHGRKPSRTDYENPNYFKDGERRLKVDMDTYVDGVVGRTSHTLTLEEYRDGKWNVILTHAGLAMETDEGTDIWDQVKYLREGKVNPIYSSLVEKQDAYKVEIDGIPANSGDGILYETTEENEEASAFSNWLAQADVSRLKDSKTYQVVRKQVPSILAQHAPEMAGLPLKIKERTIPHSLNRHPGMTAEIIGKALGAIDNPVAVGESKTVAGSLVILTDVRDKNGAPVIVPIHLNIENGSKLCAVASVYGKDHGFDDWAAGTNWVYLNENKASHILGVIRSNPLDRGGNASTRNVAPVSESVKTGDKHFESSDGGWGKGYNEDWNMSVNAVEAYGRGEMTRSEWTKARILKNIGYAYAQTPEMLEFAKTLPFKVLRSVFLEGTGWHHMGKRFTKTDFFKVNESLDVASARRLADHYMLKNRREEHLKETGGRIEHAKWTDRDGVVHEGSGVVGKDGEFVPDGSREMGLAAIDDSVRKIPEAVREFISKTTPGDVSMSGTVYEHGRKPNRSNYDDPNYFKDGERRLAVVENGEEGKYTLTFEEYGSGEWHAAETHEVQIDPRLGINLLWHHLRGNPVPEWSGIWGKVPLAEVEIDGIPANSGDGILFEDMEGLTRYEDFTVEDVNASNRELAYDKSSLVDFNGVQLLKDDPGYDYDTDTLGRLKKAVSETLFEIDGSGERGGNGDSGRFGKTGGDGGARMAVGSGDSLQRLRPGLAKYFDFTSGWNGSEPEIGIAGRWDNLGFVSFIGTRFKDSNDIAKLYSLYRNPELEYFHIAFTKGDEIVGQLAMSSGLPGVSFAVPFADIGYVKRRMGEIGADGYYLLHNHPSGNPHPSQDDLNLTRNYQKHVPGYRGHIILDHGKYYLLGENLETEVAEVDAEEGAFHAIPEEKGGSIQAPSLLASQYLAISNGDIKGKVVAFFADSGMHITGTEILDTFPEEAEVGRMLVDRRAAFVSFASENREAFEKKFDEVYARDGRRYTLDAVLLEKGETHSLWGMLDEAGIEPERNLINWQSVYLDSHMDEIVAPKWDKTDSDGTLFESSEEDAERIRREVDSIEEKDTNNPNKVVHVASRTPFVFRALGLPDLEVVMYANKLAKGIYLGPDQRHGHSDQIDHGVAKNALVRFPDPLYVFSSKTDKERSLVAVYDVMDKSGVNPIMASVRKNVERDRIEINLVTGLYAKASQVYQSWVDTGLLLYVDDTRRNLPQSVRLQLPTEVEGSNYKVLRKSQLVNGGKGESYPTFYETSEDEADTPLYELTDEQRKEFTNKWARDVELGVRAHEPVTNQVLRLFKGQDWADREIALREALRTDPVLWDLAKEADSPEDFKKKLEYYGDENAKEVEWNPLYDIKEEVEYKQVKERVDQALASIRNAEDDWADRIWDYAHMRNRAQKDADFVKEYASDLQGLLKLKAAIGKGYSVPVRKRTKHSKTGDRDIWRIEKRFPAYKGISTKVLHIRPDSTPEQVAEAISLIKADPGRYRRVADFVGATNQYAQETWMNVEKHADEHWGYYRAMAGVEESDMELSELERESNEAAALSDQERTSTQESLDADRDIPKEETETETTLKQQKASAEKKLDEAKKKAESTKPKLTKEEREAKKQERLLKRYRKSLDDYLKSTNKELEKEGKAHAEDAVKEYRTKYMRLLRKLWNSNEKFDYDRLKQNANFLAAYGREKRDQVKYERKKHETYKANAEERYDRLKDNADFLEAYGKEKAKQVAMKQTEIWNLEKDLEDRRKRVTVLRRDLTEANETIRRLEPHVATLEKRISAMKVRQAVSALLRSIKRLGTVSQNLDANIIPALAIVRELAGAKRIVDEDSVIEADSGTFSAQGVNMLEYYLAQTDHPEAAQLIRDRVRSNRWTVDQLMALREAVRTMRADAKATLEAKNAQRRMRRQNTLKGFFTEITGLEAPLVPMTDDQGNIRSNGGQLDLGAMGRVVRDVVPDHDTADRNAIATFWDSARNHWAHIQRLARLIDGGKEGSMYDLLVRRVYGASTVQIKEVTRRMKAGEAAQKEYGVTPESLSEKLYTYQDGATTRNLTRGEVIGLYVYSQNEIEAAKLYSADGNNISPQQVAEAVAMLTDGERAWGDWMIEDFASRRSETEKVFYDEYNMPLGSRERYFPMIGDGTRQGVGEEEVLSSPDKLVGPNKAVRRDVDTSRTKQVNENARYRLKLDVTSTWFSQVRTEEHFIAWSQWVKDAQWLMQNGGLKKMIASKYGRDMADTIERYVNDMAGQGSDNATYERMLSNMLGHGAVGALGYNIVTAIKQLPAGAAAIGNTSVSNWIKAGTALVSRRKEMLAMIYEKAPDIMDRYYSPEVKAVQQRTTKAGKVLDKVVKQIAGDEHPWQGMWATSAVDRSVACHIWLSAYWTNLDNGMSEQEAVFKASQVVSETQNSNMQMDLSDVQRRWKNPLLRAALMFSNQTFQMFNLAFIDLPMYLRQREFKRALPIMANIGLNAAAMVLIGGSLLPKKGDDDDDKWKRLAAETFAQVSDLVPIYGSAVSEGIRGYTGSNDQLSGTVGATIKKILDGRMAMKDVISLGKDAGSSFAGLPSNAINRLGKVVTRGELLYLFGSNWGRWGEYKKDEKGDPPRYVFE